jgi:hypothetical protein
MIHFQPSTISVQLFKIVINIRFRLIAEEDREQERLLAKRLVIRVPPSVSRIRYGLRNTGAANATEDSESDNPPDSLSRRDSLYIR